VRARLAEIFDEQIALIEATLREAAAEGDIPPHRATRFTARALVAQLEGMVLLAKAADSPAVLDDLWPQALLLLQAADEE
jgi:TetR/AcrR family transcriptional repressor of nem operon